ncbi:YciI family protein [Gymnodinialimonas sp. 2305UL16-5]|uniref:YciI family protein n=1 Tax=Gymnodinialimonas mytili TaxID=3126503 RepID=UPI0030988CF1
MFAALICTDKPNHLKVRLENREAHLAYLEGSDQLISAGPFLNEDGDMCGSLLVLEVDDMSDAHAFAAEDPYAKAGLFQDVRIEEWKKVIG